MPRDQQPTPPSPPAAESGATDPLPPTLEQLAGEGERLDAGAPGAGPTTEPPRSDAPKGPPLDEMLTKILFVTFNIAAPLWQVKQDECALLGTAYAELLNKYFPDGVQLGPELGAIFATAVVFGPRLGVPPRPVKQSKPDTEREVNPEFRDQAQPS